MFKHAQDKYEQNKESSLTSRDQEWTEYKKSKSKCSLYAVNKELPVFDGRSYAKSFLVCQMHSACLLYEVYKKNQQSVYYWSFH